MIKVNELWQESFRPVKVDDVVLPPNVRSMLSPIVKGGKPLPHFLFYYPKPGNGKTSLAKAICNDLGIGEVLYMNASLDGNIDSLRTRISDFVMARPVGDSVKVVILDEMEKSSQAFQEALKVFLEEYTEFVRFFLISNNIAKIIDPLQSRTTLVDFRFEDPKVKAAMTPLIVERLKFILTTRGAKFDEGVLVRLVDSLYPDIRSMVKNLHIEFMENGKITEGILKRYFVDKEFYNLIIGMKYNEAQAYLKRNGCNYGDMYGRMFTEFIPLAPQKSRAEIVLTLSKYEERHTRALTPELTFAACTIEIMKEIHRCTKKS